MSKKKGMAKKNGGTRRRRKIEIKQTSAAAIRQAKLQAICAESPVRVFATQ